MARRNKFFVWRVLDAPPEDLTGGDMLQTLSREPSTQRLKWITVARGVTEYLEGIAEALNKARYQMFDLKPDPDIPWETVAYNQEGNHAGMVRKPEKKKGVKKASKNRKATGDR